jgi:hypothetical protein
LARVSLSVKAKVIFFIVKQAMCDREGILASVNRAAYLKHLPVVLVVSGVRPRQAQVVEIIELPRRGRGTKTAIVLHQ